MTPEEIKSARISLNLTQKEFMEVLGYTDKARISELERGLRKPSNAVILLIRLYLDEGVRPKNWPPTGAP